MKAIVVILLLVVWNQIAIADDCKLQLEESAERAGLIKVFDSSERNLAELSKVAKTDAEKASVDYHQAALLKALTTKIYGEIGINHRTARNAREGVVKSDMGKQDEFKIWWTDKGSNDGQLLLRSLQLKGKGPLANLLRQLNDGKAFINPEISVEVLREIFTDKVLQGYFHEFPGMRMAERELVNKEISYQDFVEQIESIYAHNGPGDPAFSYQGAQPFWANVPKMIMGNISKRVEKGELPREALDLFRGTAFESKNGELIYPDPVTITGFIHLVEDRFDGYRDSRKIRDEVRFFPPIMAEVDMLFNSNFRGTRAALIYDRDVLLGRLVKKGIVPEGQRDFLTDYINQRLQRLESMHSELNRLVENASELAERIQNQQPIESITLRISRAGGQESKTFTADEVGDGFSAAAADFRKLVDAEIRGPVMDRDQVRTD